jgi:hypothetical protein
VDGEGVKEKTNDSFRPAPGAVGWTENKTSKTWKIETKRNWTKRVPMVDGILRGAIHCPGIHSGRADRR